MLYFQNTPMLQFQERYTVGPWLYFYVCMYVLVYLVKTFQFLGTPSLLTSGTLGRWLRWPLGHSSRTPTTQNIPQCLLSPKRTNLYRVFDCLDKRKPGWSSLVSSNL